MKNAELGFHFTLSSPILCTYYRMYSEGGGEEIEFIKENRIEKEAEGVKKGKTRIVYLERNYPRTGKKSFPYSMTFTHANLPPRLKILTLV